MSPSPLNYNGLASSGFRPSIPSLSEVVRANGACTVGVVPPQSWQQQVAELKYRLRIERAVYEGACKVLNAFMGPQKGSEKTTKLKVISIALVE